MKNIALIFISFITILITSCSEMSEKEKELKSKFDLLESLAQTPEQKKVIKEKFQLALEELREKEEENKKKAEIKYSKNSDISDDFFKFCKEFWKDDKYNPAKFKIKEKEFKWKSVSFDGTIEYIVSENKSNYIAIYYKKESKKTSWITSTDKKILFLVNFEKPEDIMDFKEDQKVSVKAIYDNGYLSESPISNDKTYFFNFFNPVVN